MRCLRRFITILSVTVLMLAASLACTRYSNHYTEASTLAVIRSTTRPSTLAANEPELPRVFLNTAMVAPTGKTINVAAGGNLQSAIDQAQAGDVIVLQAGATYSGNFLLRAKPAATQGSPWILIRTSTADSNFPAAGTRVSPANSNLMPKVITPNQAPVINVEKGAHHYRFTGIEFGISPSATTVYDLIELDGEPQSLAELSRDMIFDRCYIHGNETGVARRGIGMNSATTAVIDSYISNFHDTSDAQAIAGWGGPGPFKIVNNYLEATGENFLLGGADPAINGLIPSDIEFQYNTCAKPLKWKQNDPAYAGIKWTVKNLFELKNSARVLVNRNVFEYNWADGQDGMAILFTPRNQSGGSPWSVVEDVTFTNNIIRHVGGGFNIAGPDNEAGVSEPSRRVLIKNNLIDDVDGVKWGAPNEAVDAEFLQILGGAEYITIDHNTVFHTGNILTTDAPLKPNVGFVYKNNITAHNNYGVVGADTTSGTPTLNLFFPGSIFQKNVIVGSEVPEYPANNFIIGSFDNVGFINRAAGNYRLAANSPYKNAGTDGQDLGCNIDVLLAQSVVTNVNAANYRENLIAVSSIVSAFGSQLASETASAVSQPLPTTLGGTTVKIQDVNGVERLAPLFFVSPTQVNFMVPSDTAYGDALITVVTASGANAVSQNRIDRIAPGLFAADASGRGLPTGLALRVRSNQQIYEPIASFDVGQNKWQAIPIDLTSAFDKVFLVLFGTGIRNHSGLSNISVTIGGINAQVTFAGAQANLVGVDQLNIAVPRALIGRGDVDLILTVEGQSANPMTLNIK